MIRLVETPGWSRGAAAVALIVLAAGIGARGRSEPPPAGGSAPNDAERFPRFAYHRIDNIGSKLGQTDLADVDRDGDLDWISGEADHGGSRIWWWEFRAPGDWARHELGKGNTDVGGAAFDVDGDGWVDFLSGTTLLLNSRSPRERPFAAHDVGTIYSHDTEFADIDRDGRIDALANSDRSGLFWYTIPADPRQRWTSHTIAAKDAHEVHGGISPRAVGDLDGDGDNDVVTGEAWHENADGRGLEWRQRKNIDFGERHQYGLAVRTWVADLDGDRDLDLVQAEADNPDGRIAWFENDGKGSWTRHIIQDAGEKQDYHSLAVADFDGDGDLDVCSGGGPLSAMNRYICSIWENTAGAGKRPGAGDWRRRIILEGKQCHETVAADVDGDGDVDICSKPWDGTDEHFFLENLAASARAP